MIFGVMSDTHGNLVLMHRVAGLLLDRLHAERIYHLGDDYRDAEDLMLHGLPVRAVPGLWCDEYHHPRIAKRLVEDIDGLTLVAVHADKDLRPIDLDADIVMTGHTHQAALERVGGALRLNPGHLKTARSRDAAPSFAWVEVLPDRVEARIHEIDGKTRFEIALPRARGPVSGP